MFKVTRNIHLLHIVIYDIELDVIHENIGYLHHLRYLRFPASDVNLLPSSLRSLYHLQFITFVLCSGIIISYNYYFPGIGKLQFLQDVKEFCINDENGYRIDELEHLNELGSLGIVNLKNVRDAEDDYNAKLCDKRNLTFLSLNWDIEERDIADRDLCERVLDDLQPHNYLKKLWIHGCQVSHMDERGPYYHQS